MRGFSLAVLLVSCPAAQAQFSASGDQLVTGQVGIGTAIPRARVEVRASASDSFALRVSSPNGTALLVVDRAGSVGIGNTSPDALLDVPGQGDGSDIGLQLRSGNSSSTVSSSQIVFAAESSGTYRHSLRTKAVAGQGLYNEMDFFLWRSTGQPLALGDMEVLSLTTASVHVRPVGTPLYDLVVSDGLTTGAGRVRAAAIGTHSSRELKTVLSELGDEETRRAYEDVKALKAAYFRYKKERGPLRRGLIYEDAPAGIRESRGRSIVFEARLMNMELALKAAHRRIKELEGRISALEKEGRL